MYRVFVGPFDGRETALALLPELQQLIPAAYILYMP